MGQSDANCTVLPASSAPLTSLMRSGSSTVQFWCFAHSSTANTPFASVAVVITGTAPHTAASARARSLAPPRWPERMGTAKRPHSSSTTTAGSCALLWQWAQWPAPQCPQHLQKQGHRSRQTGGPSNRQGAPARLHGRSGSHCRDMPPPVFGPVQGPLP